MGSFRVHAAAPVAAMLSLPLSVTQTIVAAVEDRPGGPVGDHFSSTEDGSPRPARVTAAAAGMLEGVHLSMATDHLLLSMESVGWPSPLR